MFEWNITYWSKWRKKAELNPNCRIVSEPLHTGPQGYRLLLVLYPDGIYYYSKPHISVRVLMHSTDYETKLHEKTDGKFSFTLIDQQRDAMNVVVREETILKCLSFQLHMRIQQEDTLQAIEYTILHEVNIISHETLRSRSYIRKDEIFYSVLSPISICLTFMIIKTKK